MDEMARRRRSFLIAAAALICVVGVAVGLLRARVSHEHQQVFDAESVLPDIYALGAQNMEMELNAPGTGIIQRAEVSLRGGYGVISDFTMLASDESGLLLPLTSVLSSEYNYYYYDWQPKEGYRPTCAAVFYDANGNALASVAAYSIEPKYVFSFDGVNYLQADTPTWFPFYDLVQEYVVKPYQASKVTKAS